MGRASWQLPRSKTVLADIDYSSGTPELKDQRVVMDNAKGEVKGAVLEPQNFRPGNEDELTVQSSHGGTEVMGLNLKTGELVNYSKSPASYDEPEGIYPDGQYTLVESIFISLSWTTVVLGSGLPILMRRAYSKPPIR
jgi:hypothetical protein